MAGKNPPTLPIGAVLDQSLKRLELGKRLDEYGVWTVWDDVVGQSVANNAQPEKIRNGTLFIKVSSPVWLQQLQYMKEMITDKLNQRLGSEIVKNLFFVVGRINPASSGGARPTTDEPTVEQAPPPKIDTQFLQSVTDPDIRQAFEQLLKSYARRKPKPT